MISASPYNLVRLQETITLQPHQLNGRYREYMLHVLKSKVERQVVHSGMVMKVEEITHFDQGQINKINFRGLATFELEYNCVICAPVKGMQIPCVVRESIPGVVRAEFGPLSIYCEASRSDSSHFTVDSDMRVFWKRTGSAIESGDYITVIIDTVMHAAVRSRMQILAHIVGPSTAEIMRDSESIIETISTSGDDGDEFV